MNYKCERVGSGSLICNKPAVAIITPSGKSKTWYACEEHTKYVEGLNAINAIIQRFDSDIYIIKLLLRNTRLSLKTYIYYRLDVTQIEAISSSLFLLPIL